MFNKADFINGFIEYYTEIRGTTADQLSLIFDDYVSIVIDGNSKEINEFIVRKYHKTLANANKISKLKKKVRNVLFECFYFEIEDAIIDNYDSEADTVIEIENQYEMIYY